MILKLKTLIQNNILSWYFKSVKRYPPYVPSPDRIRPFRDCP